MESSENTHERAGWNGRSTIAIECVANGGFVVSDIYSRDRTAQPGIIAACSTLDDLARFLFAGRLLPDPPYPFPPHPNWNEAHVRAVHGAGKFPPFPKPEDDDGA